MRWIVKNPYDQKVDKKEELELIFTIYLSDFNKIFFEKTYWALFEVVELKNKHFKQRNIFRDNGIVISISVIQWIVEVLHMNIFYFYIYMIVGYSNIIDKFFNLYLIIIMVVVLPSFYLNGEAAFRRNLVAHGPFRAMKNVIIGKMWITQENMASYDLSMVLDILITFYYVKFYLFKKAVWVFSSPSNSNQGDKNY